MATTSYSLNEASFDLGIDNDSQDLSLHMVEELVGNKSIYQTKLFCNSKPRQTQAYQTLHVSTFKCLFHIKTFRYVYYVFILY